MVYVPYFSSSRSSSRSAYDDDEDRRRRRNAFNATSGREPETSGVKKDTSHPGQGSSKPRKRDEAAEAAARRAACYDRYR